MVKIIYNLTLTILTLFYVNHLQFFTYIITYNLKLIYYNNLKFTLHSYLIVNYHKKKKIYQNIF